jgi:putative endonuclease
MDARRQLGNRGEIIAARFLEAKGYKILEHQFKVYGGEVDLIAEKDEEIIFVEVKTRQSLLFGYPENTITRRKLQRMVLAGQVYLEKQQIPQHPFRLDVVAIILSIDQPPQIEHFEGVDAA